MKAQIDTQWKVIRAHVVKEQKKKTEQRNEMDKMKENEQKKEGEEKKEVKQKRRKIDYLSKEKGNVKEGVHLKSADEKKIIDAKTKKKHDQKQPKTYTRKHYEAGRWMNFDRDY